MSGVSWFPFYPRDWFLDTRGLSDRARGFYVDLLAATYARGEPLPLDEEELRKLGGYKQIRTMRAVLDELLESGKLHLVDGRLVNNRAMEELGKADKHRSDGATGGRPRKSTKRHPKSGINDEKSLNKSGVSEMRTAENQGGNRNPPQPQPYSVPNGTAQSAHLDDAVQQDLLAIPHRCDRRKEAAPQPSPVASINPAEVIFSTCRLLLTDRYGFDDAKARKMLGALRRDHGDPEIIAAFTRLQAKSDVQDPVPWLRAALAAAKPNGGNGSTRPTAPAIGTPEAEERAREWGYAS